MARAGRKRKEGARWPSGQLRRPTLAERLAAEIATADAEKVVVLAQPHRRGERDQKAESAIGRFVMRRRIEDECFTAGLRYAQKRRMWRAVKGAPMPDRLSGSGADVSADVVDGWRKELDSMEDAMLTCGVAAFGWVETLACDDRDMPVGHPSEDDTVRALRALAVERGLIAPRRY